MKQIVLDLNVFVRDLAKSLSSALHTEEAPKTVLARQKMAVMLDPAAMRESLTTLVESRDGASSGRRSIALGTRFLPIDCIDGDNDDKAGCALLYINFASAARNHTEADYVEKGWTESPVFRVVCQNGGSMRVLRTSLDGERMNIYLPVLDESRFMSWHLSKDSWMVSGTARGERFVGMKNG